MPEADIRQTEGYRAVLEHYRRWLAPGFARPMSFSEVAVHPHEDRVVATATVLTELSGLPQSRLFSAGAGGSRFLTGTHGNARLPRFSPDGTIIAFLSDREQEGSFQLHLLDDGPGEATATPHVDGVVEHLVWSPDGSRILLVAAGHGADAAGATGSGTLAEADGDPRPGWLPAVEGATPTPGQWRTAWVHDLASGTTTRVSREGLNVWDATWAGPDRLAVVASEGDPREGAWYSADVRAMSTDGSDERVVLRPARQLGALAGNDAGTWLAVVEAVASDRGLVAGRLHLVDLDGGAARTVDGTNTDVADVGWLDNDRLGWSGLRGLDSVYGTVDVRTGAVEERWATQETSGTRYPEAAWRSDGSFACTLESYERPVALVIVRDREAVELVSTRSAGTDHLASVAGRLERVSWTGRDGLEIQGLLARPDADGPVPLVVMVHGGPVWAYRNRWTMGYDFTPLLVAHGYAVLHPNPRGSTGRGAEFAELVVGDMGGEDTHDLLTGIDALVRRGIADPARVGVTGGSYGGYMSAWLTTQDQRLRAAVALSPVTNWLSQHHTSNIGCFDLLFLDGRPRDADGLAWSRSPLLLADRIATPTLLTAGAQDRTSPPTQALELHRALVEMGVESQCVIYPEEGHGVRTYPARVDLAARMLGWFQRHMPA